MTFRHATPTTRQLTHTARPYTTATCTSLKFEEAPIHCVDLDRSSRLAEVVRTQWNTRPAEIRRSSSSSSLARRGRRRDVGAGGRLRRRQRHGHRHRGLPASDVRPQSRARDDGGGARYLGRRGGGGHRRGCGRGRGRGRRGGARRGRAEGAAQGGVRRQRRGGGGGEEDSDDDHHHDRHGDDDVLRGVPGRVRRRGRAPRAARVRARLPPAVRRPVAAAAPDVPRLPLAAGAQAQPCRDDDGDAARCTHPALNLIELAPDYLLNYSCMHPLFSKGIFVCVCVK